MTTLTTVETVLRRAGERLREPLNQQDLDSVETGVRLAIGLLQRMAQGDANPVSDRLVVPHLHTIGAYLARLDRHRHFLSRDEAQALLVEITAEASVVLQAVEGRDVVDSGQSRRGA